MNCPNYHVHSRRLGPSKICKGLHLHLGSDQRQTISINTARSNFIKRGKGHTSHAAVKVVQMSKCHGACLDVHLRLRYSWCPRALLVQAIQGTCDANGIDLLGIYGLDPFYRPMWKTFIRPVVLTYCYGLDLLGLYGTHSFG